MSEPKHTPGPWNINYDDKPGGWIDIYDDNKILITSIMDCEILEGERTILSFEQTEANAYLLSAAPEMYEALLDCCGECVDTFESDSACRFCSVGKALRKARGEIKDPSHNLHVITNGTSVFKDTKKKKKGDRA